MNLTRPHSDRSLMVAAELEAPAAKSAEKTRYALVQPAGSIVTVLDTGYGYLRLTADENQSVQTRLAKLEGGSRRV